MAATVQVIIDDNYLQKEVSRQVNERLVDMGIGTWWDMKRLQYETSRSYDWLMEYVVCDPRVQEFAKQKNNRWLFKAKEMKEFLNKYFDEL
ncbi:DUF771 domain-containing protein [Bacillus toyonensis]|uniref:DUF771 domain-containing protein n=1 Tax=Bacillus toyonensis TaxID=155322 RepID=UPI000BF03BE7|nr:DUF771 domain-containing protein [Bacillus toyonensis]PEK87948.1 hypothetical protein CN594_08485 [Bacillus toyonensis]PFY37712.1 hypothetical protein COL54_23690 [Bacillus toyonensis]PFY50024.1 hypothetical protein COL55_11195 [Bacillus toyonensis]PFY67856.1 hypothetical protein COL62_26695 [Bacillus toyonensis]PGD12590.1 hypothetical protein COM37_28495 [Bacillus toyonensis]